MLFCCGPCFKFKLPFSCLLSDVEVCGLERETEVSEVPEGSEHSYNEPECECVCVCVREREREREMRPEREREKTHLKKVRLLVQCETQPREYRHLH